MLVPLVAEDVPDSLIADLSEDMPREWNKVAAYLGLKNDYIETLNDENRTISNKVIAMLNKWKHTKGKSATRSCLMSALQKAGRKDLVDKVRMYKE